MAAFIIQQGTDSGRSWPVTSNNGQPMSFVGWSGKAQIRSITNHKLLHEFTTEGSNLILNDSKVTVLWTNEETSDWKWDQAIFGIELTDPSGKVLRFKQELVMLSKETVV